MGSTEQRDTKQAGRRVDLGRAGVCLVVSAWFSGAGAGGLCERPQNFDPDGLPGLVGEYELIGRAPDSATPYRGRLHIGTGDRSYTLRRILGAERAAGSAWIEYCSPDRYQVLMFSLAAPREPLLGRCFPRTDGDNYYLLSCYTRYPDGGDAEGLEAMFQLPGDD